MYLNTISTKQKLIVGILFNLFLLLGNISFISAQNQAFIDSLENEFQRSNDLDQKFIQAEELFYQKIYIKPEDALPYANEALLLAQKSKNARYECTALEALAAYYRFIGQPDSAKICYYQSLEINEHEVKDSIKLGAIYSNLGGFLIEQGVADSAYTFLTAAKEIFTAQRDTLRLVITTTNLGVVYNAIGQYQKAIDLSLEALRLAEKNKLGCELTNAIYVNLGGVYLELDQLDKAKEYELRAKECAEQLGNLINKTFALNNLGFIAEEQGEIEEAFEYFEIALTLNKENNSSKAHTLSGLGDCHFKKGNFDQAIDYYQQTMQLSEQLEHPTEVAIALADLGYAEVNNQNYFKGIQKIREAYAKLVELNNPLGAGEAKLLEIYSQLKQNKHNNISANLTHYNNLRKEVFNQDIAKAISYSQILYQTRQKQDSIELLKLRHERDTAELREKEANNKILLILSLTAFGIGVLFFLLHRVTKNRNTLLGSNNEMLKAREEELKELNVDLSKKLKNKEIIESLPDEYIILSDPNHTRVRYKDILYIEAQRNDTFFHFANEEKVKSNAPMKYYNEFLPKELFLKCQRSYIVNLMHVKNYNSTRLTVNNSHIEIKFTRGKSKELIAKIEAYRNKG